METPTIPIKDIDSYIATQPEATGHILEQLRQIIKEIAPEAEEIISYNMPAFKLNGMLVWYAAYKNHIGLYPVPREAAAFKKELSGYEGKKSTLQLPLDKPIPVALISKIVKFLVKRDLERTKEKTKKK